MDIDDLEQFKQFIRDNVEIETEFESSSGNNINVGLRIVGDEKPFSKTTVYVPDYLD